MIPSSHRGPVRFSHFHPVSVFPALLSVLLALGGVSGCGPAVQHYALVDAKLAQDNYPAADEIVEKNKEGYGARNAVLYYLDRGMLLHLSGRYVESNAFLAKAEDRIAELYTKSVTGEASAMLANDNTLPYEGEDFEKVLINVISALNYAFLGEGDEALVEARKVDHKLNLFNDRYEKKNIYKQDALAQYLSGILYEAKKEWNDAFISYRKAFDAYGVYRKNYGTPMPPVLPVDLLRVTAAIPLPEEHREYLRQFPDTPWMTQKEMNRRGEVVFLAYVGRSPVKEDVFIDAPVPDGQGGVHVLRVALPKFVPQPTRIHSVEIRLTPEGDVPGGDPSLSTTAFLAEDISAIAQKDLEDRVGRITAKAIARVTAKYLASREVRKEVSRRTDSDPLARFLTDLGTNIYSVASEQSDKRSWRTLPGEIRLARLSAPPGRYTLVADFLDSGGGRVAQKTFPSVILKPGGKTFLNYRVLGR